MLLMLDRQVKLMSIRRLPMQLACLIHCNDLWTNSVEQLGRQFIQVASLPAATSYLSHGRYRLKVYLSEFTS